MPLDHHSAARRRWLTDLQQRSSHLETQRQQAINWLRSESKNGWILDKKQERLAKPLPR